MHARELERRLDAHPSAVIIIGIVPGRPTANDCCGSLFIGLKPELCADGVDCNGIEPNGRCVVECTRSCKCDATTGKLVCVVISC